jgi:adenylate cyclase
MKNNSKYVPMRWLLLLSFVSCSYLHEYNSFAGYAKIRAVSSFTETVDSDCSNFSETITFPSSINLNPEYRKNKFWEYCLELEENYFRNVASPGINLGYIDNQYRIYFNGELVSSSQEEEELGQSIFYDKEVLFKIPSKKILSSNVIIIQVSKYSTYDSGGGIYAGMPRIASYISLKRQREIFRAYNFGKIVLFYSTCVLFFILFFSRRKEKELLWFAIFLLTISIYYTTKLEIRYEMGWDILFCKRLEYILSVLIFPPFLQFIYHLIKRKSKDYIIQIVSVIEIIFACIFVYQWDLNEIIYVNNKYHIPFLIFIFILLAVILLNETFRRNKRAIPTLLIIVLPFILSFFQLANNRFEFIPSLSNLLLIGDSILLLVISMSCYVSFQFYILQKKLDVTIHKEEVIRKTFQLYVPPSDIEKILNSFNDDQEVVVNGITEVQTILFCDIRDFTDLSEKMRPSEVVEFLNSYFKKFNAIIVENGGIIDKLIGDCIMARFSAGKEANALEAAFQFMEELLIFNKDRKDRKLKPINHGLGICVGEVIVGNIGSINKMDYTVIGDTVNTASRLESLTKFYQVPILVTDTLVRLSMKKFIFREIDTIRIKGKKKPTKIFEPLGRKTST